MPLMLLSQTGQTVRQDTFPSTPSPTSPGTVITASGSANTKGSWTQLISSTDNNSWGFILQVFTGQVSAAQRTRLIDIGIGGEGSEVVLLPDFPGTVLANWVTQGLMSYYIPLFIPKGTRVAARLQCSTASGTIRLQMVTNPIPNNLTFTEAEAIGINSGTSLCTAVTAGNATYSSYVNIGSTTSRQYKAIQLFTGTDTNTTMADLSMYVDWGYSSTTIGRSIVAESVGEAISNNGMGLPDYVTVPSGTQLQSRAIANAAGVAFGVMLMGYY